MSPSERRDRERIRQRNRHRPGDRHKNKHRGANRQAEFVGVDGEGAGEDAQGRQCYCLIRAGDRELWTGKPLGTEEIFEFLLSLSPHKYYVGFWLQYDITMILRDWPEERLRRLFADDRPATGSPYTFHRGYGVDCIPGHFFRVCRRADPNGYRAVPGSSRTIHEAGRFFGGSFYRAVSNWGVATPDELKTLDKYKKSRSRWAVISTDIRGYCALECDLLGRLMERFREAAKEADLIPERWEGPGWIAALLHKRYGTPRRDTLGYSEALEKMAVAAFAGGRNEVIQYGAVPGPVYGHDIHSAYPAALLRLPCPLHGRWRRFSGEPPADCGDHYVARCFFRAPESSIAGPLPIRRNNGDLYWPLCGNGTYHGPEIEAARRAGAYVEIKGGYYHERACECDPYGWVRDLYRRRLALGAAGEVVKLALNSLYGKLCQRAGAAPWRDYLAAGYVTACARAALLDAVALAPGDIVMLAVDGIFARRPLALDLGPDMGQWAAEKFPRGLFVMQPGIWWEPGRGAVRSKGLPPRVLGPRVRHDIEATWRTSDSLDVSVPVPVPLFIGHRQAIVLNNIALAGSWRKESQTIRFDWREKRGYARRVGDLMTTLPDPGGPDLISRPFDPDLLTEIDRNRREQEAMPDCDTWI